jgi:hypothetical protein
MNFEPGTSVILLKGCNLYNEIGTEICTVVRVLLQGIDYNPLVDISVENKIYTVRSCYLKKV